MSEGSTVTQTIITGKAVLNGIQLDLNSTARLSLNSLENFITLHVTVLSRSQRNGRRLMTTSLRNILVRIRQVSDISTSGHATLGYELSRIL